MTDKFIPPPPSAEAIEAFIKRTSSGGGTWAEHIAAANAVDQPRVCREEVEAYFRWFFGVPHIEANTWDYLDARYGPAAGAAPTPEPVQTPPGIADVVALHQAGNAPHLCDRPETLAFLRDVAMENQYLGSARRFLDATREAK